MAVVQLGKKRGGRRLYQVLFVKASHPALWWFYRRWLEGELADRNNWVTPDDQFDVIKSQTSERSQHFESVPGVCLGSESFPFFRSLILVRYLLT